MPVVDFKLPKGGCDVILSGDVAKTDAASDLFLFRVDVTLPLTSHEEARVAGRMLPGLAEMYLQADENNNWKAGTSVKPATSLLVVLTAKEAASGLVQGAVAPGSVIIQGTAELVELKASLSKRARVVLARFLFRGQAASVAEGLIQNRGRSVGLAFEQVQAVLPFATSAKPPALRPGMIVAASRSDGVQVLGRLVEIDGDQISLQEAGTEITVETSAVISAFAFSEDADTQAALSDYQERCERREVPVSWAALVSVLNASGGTSTPKVTSDDVEAAMAKLDSQTATDTGPAEGAAQEPAQPMGEVVLFEQPEATPKRQPRARARA